MDEEFRTYKRADGEMIGDFSWVVNLEFFEDELEPVELVEETWALKERRRLWHMPTVVSGSCAGDDASCDEDAEYWVQDEDGEWVTVCPRHKESLDEPDRV